MTAKTCSRCGGHHDTRECLIEDVVCEIENRLRVHGPSSIEALKRHLETSLGVSSDIADEAIARSRGAS